MIVNINQRRILNILKMLCKIIYKFSIPNTQYSKYLKFSVMVMTYNYIFDKNETSHKNIIFVLLL